MSNTSFPTDFYVSSIVGLGAKQGEEFIDEDYQDVYDKEITSYTNSEAKHPKSLYRYDIVPEQVKDDALNNPKENQTKLLLTVVYFGLNKKYEFLRKYILPTINVRSQNIFWMKSL